MKVKKILFAVLRLGLIALSAITVLAYIGPVVTVHELNIGTLTGFAFAAVFIIYAVFFHKINAFIAKAWSKKSGKIIVSILSVLVVIGIAFGGTIFAQVVNGGRASEEKTDAIIVLGCQVNGDRPGPYLRFRIATAYDYLTANPDSVAVLSGGQGAGENISEAQCMYNSLTEKGISPDRLIMESTSTSTKENFKNAKELLKQQGIKNDELTVVTNEFHEYRAGKIAEKCGIKVYKYPCKTPKIGYMSFATREVYAVLAQVVL